VVVAVCLIANVLRAAERVESVVLRTVSPQKLLVRQLLHRFRFVELNISVVDGVASLALIAHGAGVAHVECGAVAHEALHTLNILLRLVQACEWRHFHFRLEGRAAAEPKSRHSRVASVPEVVAGTHHFHVDAAALVNVLCERNLIVEPLVVTELLVDTLLVGQVVDLLRKHL